MLATEPRPLTPLRLEMMKRGLSMRELSRRSGVPYASMSGILNGRLIQPTNLRKIQEVIDSEPEPLTPEEYRAQTLEIAGRAGRIKIAITSPNEKTESLTT